MTPAAPGSQLFQYADDFLNFQKTLRILKAVILDDSLDFLNRPETAHFHKAVSCRAHHTG